MTLTTPCSGRWRRAALAAIVVASILLGALPIANATSAGIATTSTAGAEPSAPVIPDSPVGAQLSWALAQVNGNAAALTAADVTARFSPDFLAALPPDPLIAVLRQLTAGAAPFALARFEGAITDTEAGALLTTAGGPWRVTIAVEAAAPHRIVDLFFEPVPLPAPPADPPATWAAFDAQVRPLAPTVGFLAAEIVDGACQPVHGLNADRPLAIASAFKLYVLGALGRAIEAGRASWDEALVLRDDAKSLPSGDLRYEPAGAVYPLRDYAERMIAESDNTATDHLIARLGRENVEAAQDAMGHADPALNTPLLTTREWFAIKLRFTAAQVDTYLAASDAEQRRILAQEVAPLADTLWNGEEWAGAYLIDSVEWFASPADLCRAMAALHTMADRPGLAPIHGVLSANPGLPFDPAVWSYVGFKSGAETGVLNRTWLLGRTDGRWFVLSLALNDPAQPVDGVAAEQLLVAAADLLARAR